MISNITTWFNKIINKKEDERFYYLSLIKKDKTFSIHGLWPQTNKGHYPTYCKKVDFSIEALKPIINDLNRFWHSNTHT